MRTRPICSQDRCRGLHGAEARLAGFGARAEQGESDRRPSRGGFSAVPGFLAGNAGAEVETGGRRRGLSQGVKIIKARRDCLSAAPSTVLQREKL